MTMESRDAAIKLFGMKIPFPAVFESAGTVEEEEEEDEFSGGDEGVEKSKEKVTPELSDKEKKNSPNNSIDSKPEARDKEETGSTDQIESCDSPEENQQKTKDGKILKKPTKILPCPRCKSMETKFCYYNNYNINQPRHFCKACQRYWTAGGTMRNVPVGAGRRKNKSSSSQYRHITISEALEAARLDPGLQANTRVLSFGLDAHQQQAIAPMMPVMKLQVNQKVPNGARNGFHGLADQRLAPRVENGDDSSGSSVTTSNNHLVDESRAQSGRVINPNMNNNMNGYACIPGVPWPYTWNPAMPPPGFYPPPGYPMPFYPSYWPIPMLPPHQSSSPISQKTPTTLGKHSRDEEEHNNPERQQKNSCVLVPKTLRIDDPNEAAKSSIWTTLGIKNEGISKSGGMFKGFDQKMKMNHNDKAENSPVLSANPAAMSRSLNFHERT